MRYFITLLILFGCLDGYSQKVAVRLNALPATDGAFGAGVSYGIGNKSTVELAGSLRPWKRSEMYVNRYRAIASSSQVMSSPPLPASAST